MAVAANIVLADAQATPVNHTFVPLGADKNGVFWFEDQSAASAVGFWKISLELKRPQVAAPGESSQNRTFRIKIGMHQPIMENVTNSTVSGVAPAPTVSYIPRCFTEFLEPERSSLQNRKDLRKMVANLLTETQVVGMVETLQGVW